MRRHVIAVVVTSLLLAIAALDAHAQQFSSLEERMSTADFKAAGLDKLSPQELARLNAFVRTEMGQRVAAARNKQDPERIGFHDSNASRELIVSHVPGKFTGWNDHSTFTLENGQVWQVQDPDAVLAVFMQDPEVTIKPGLLGGWLMTVHGYNATARVQRIK